MINEPLSAILEYPCASDMTDSKGKNYRDILSEDVGNSTNSVLNWQQRLRSAVDDLVIAKLSPSFNAELSNRLIGSIASKRETSSWANGLLREAGLCISSPIDGSPSGLRAIRSRENDLGRVYLESFSQGPNRHRTRVEPSTNVELRPLPNHAHHFSRSK